MLSLIKRYRELIVVSALLLYPFGTFLARGPTARDPNFIDRAIIAITAAIAVVVKNLRIVFLPFASSKGESLLPPIFPKPMGRRWSVYGS